jgi:hypothetical protein
MGIGLALLLTLLAGCGKTGAPKTFPVSGKVVFENGDVKLLSGSSVYRVHAQDGAVAARGNIREDGGFTLKTHWQGQVLAGALEGTYRVQIVPDENKGTQESEFRRMGIDPRFLHAATSPLSFKVPVEGEVVLTVTRAKPGAK